ncbi:Conserved glutamic acid rich protein [Venustampulla echinocandica]|uniref:Conserved glutamic acid rich protein n=1 Tax=Venustampulla echinocandica TaxID=2656787 RepID=A0A370U102_9HELO|nr:Conserved glutamic acid rich protein [Venustampulla echinocandica]RDL41452.1 Conserved glutamic acid rich protein [Venustampulla echinocandica]
MSRRGDAVYEEHDYYSRQGPLPVRTREREREYEETDVYSRRDERDSRPAFLRDDFGRQEPGQLVIREHDTESYTTSRPLERRPRSPSPVRVRERERIFHRSPSPPDRLRARVTETRERVRERSPSPVRVQERFVERVRQRSPSPPPDRLRARVTETRERVRERSPSPVRIRERFIERERQRTPSPPRLDTSVRIRNIDIEQRESRRPSPSPSPSPSPPRSIRAPPIHQEIITHHRHIDHGFERVRVPSPPPPPRRSKETRETDIDIHTSRDNTEIDITRSKSRSRTPQPASRPRRNDFFDDSDIYDQERDKLRVRDTRVDIDRRRSVSARPDTRDRDMVKVDIREDFGHHHHDHLHDDDDEAEYYQRKVAERAFIGEAYNGATKDWAIVDVPPGTERVRMDGVGGASQDITWQRYNGVRRSKFIPERERDRVEIREREEPRREKIDVREETNRETSNLEIEISTSNNRRHDHGPVYEREREYERIEETSDRRVGMPRPPPKNRTGDLWTEITKDLVVREAIEQMGYDFEETEYFYYIIQYLRYEDVLELVKISEHIRRERQHRIREIERERERFEKRARERVEWERAERRRERDRRDGSETVFDDERIIEREIIYDSGGRRLPPRSHRGGW